MELLFPIIGFLFFDWSFLIIVLFYLVDQLGNQVNFFARLRFVQTLYLPKKKVLFPLALGIFSILFLIELFLLYPLFLNYLYDCQPGFLHSELIDFLKQEFWLFLPLLIFANYLKDKMAFYKTDLPYKESPEKMLILNSIKIISAFGLVALIWALWLIFKPSAIWLIIIIAGLKLLFDTIIFSFFKTRFFKKI